MEKKRTANTQKCQPLLKNISIIGTTFMISSSVLIPSLSTKVYADSIKDPSETANEQAQVIDEQKDKLSMDINSFDTVSLVKESANQFDITLDLLARSVENENVAIQISPNVNLISEEAKLSVIDETGKKIGTYTIDNQLNKINIVFSDAHFTHAKLIVSASIKKFDLSEQVVTASLDESIRSKSVITEKTEQEFSDETEQTEETNQNELPITNEDNTIDKELNEPSEIDDSIINEEKVTEESTITDEQEAPNETQKNDGLTAKPDLDENTSTQTVVKESEIDEITANDSDLNEQTTDTLDESNKEILEEDNEKSANELASAEKETTTDNKDNESTTSEKEELDFLEDQISEQLEPVSLVFSTTSRSLLSSKDQFIQNVAAHAQGVASENGLYASVMIAQAILESGYGTSALSSAPNYNLFGIKGAYNGQSVTMQTWEYFNGQNVTINAQFRKYPSYRQSFEDNARVLKTTSFSPGSYFYSGAWKANTNSYQDATRWLTGKYATDPNYNIKLNNLILTYNLTQYDTPNSESGTNNSQNNSNSSSNNSNVINTGTVSNTVSGNLHTVKSGDTLYAIGLKYGVTVAQLKSWNNLASDTIYVGQTLTVSDSKKVPNTSTTNAANKPTKTPQTNTVNNNNNTIKESTHTVKSGDTLYGIGKKYGVTVVQLKSWNNLSSDIIYVNQTLQLKTKTTVTNTVSAANSSTNTEANNQTSQYTVKSGDTLYGIGKKYGVSIAQLKSWNNLSSDIIYVNQRLSVKNQSNAPENAQKETTTQVTHTNATNNSYTVKSGDTLYRIALDNHVSVNNLKSWNNLTTDLINIGQKLIVKQNANSGVLNTSTKNNSTNYTVKSGDSLYRISLKYGISVNELKELNSLSGTMIYVGQTLKVTTNKAVTVAQKTTKKTSRHSVKAGDSLWALANKYGTSVSKIKSMNNLASDVIYIGQNLSIG